jgi:thiol:disulfide interchange protein DsbC
MLFFCMRNFCLVFIIMLISFAGFLYTPVVSGTEQPANHDCIKCHKITNEEAAGLLKDFAPDIKMIETRALPAKGLWELTVEAKGQKAIVYIDFSKQYFFYGSLIDIKTKTNLTQNRLAEMNKIEVSQIPLDDALLMGEKDAKYQVIVFTDPDCGYCEKLHQEIKKVIDKRKDIAFLIKMFPLRSDEKAKAIICEKSLALLEDAYAKKPLPKPSCETEVANENRKLAEKLGIRGTPALILSNGLIVPGYKDADSLINIIDTQSSN